MVSLETVRASNAKLKNLPPGLVALFGILIYVTSLKGLAAEHFLQLVPRAALEKAPSSSSIAKLTNPAFILSGGMSQGALHIRWFSST